MIYIVSLMIFLIFGTVFDIRKRSIPVSLFVVFGIAGIVLGATQGRVSPDLTTDWVFGVILGVVFIAISLISDKKLGMGDALSILIMGIYLGGSDAALAVLYAMMITSVFSIIILAFKKGSRKTELPFMPFLLTGCIIQQIGALI